MSQYVTAIVAWGGKDHELLKLALRSLSIQFTPVNEVIVVIDSEYPEKNAGEVEALIESCSVKVLTTPNLGPASARNKALAHLNPQTSHILIQDADDVSHPSRVLTLLNEMNTRELDAIGSQAVLIGKRFLSLHPHRQISESKLKKMILEDEMKFVHPSMLFKVRNRLNEFSYPETNLRGEDFLLIRDLMKKGWKIGNSSQYLYGYRHTLFRSFKTYILDVEIRTDKSSRLLFLRYAGHLVLRAISIFRSPVILFEWRKYLKDLQDEA